MKQADLKWFEPLWRRILVTGICAAWCAFEWLVSKDQLWGFLTLGVTAYAVWTFFISFKTDNDAEPKA